MLELLIEAAQTARLTSLDDVAGRCDAEYAGYVRRWPGEHYRLLTALVSVLRPSLVIDVGTFQGHSALALLAGSETTRVITYDVLPASEIAGSILKAEDLQDGRIEQRVGDLSDPGFLATQWEALRSADLLFVDGPKDGRFEYVFRDLVLPGLTDRRRVLVFDDIRLLPMVELWRSLPYGRLDATSLGHWSGTGLLETRPA